MFIPCLCFGQVNPHTLVNNAWDWSVPVTTATDVAWQIWNATTNAKTVYITDVLVTSDKAGYFTAYSTNVATGFTGTKVGGTPLKTLTGLSINEAAGTTHVAISSAVVSYAVTVPTGNILWQGVILGSTSFPLLGENHAWGLRPGQAVYVLKSNPVSTDAKSAVSFHFIESYR